MNDNGKIFLLPKQQEAFKYLTDTTTTEILYGGSIGGGKTRVACYYAIWLLTTYPGSRILIGRSHLTELKQTTLKTLVDCCNELGIPDFINVRENNNIIPCSNGSEIILMDLFLKPSDSELTKLGSLEVTAAIIDEGSGITEKSKTVLKTRIRYKLKEFKLLPKLLICSNPSKNWLYSQFYKPFINGTLPPFRKFIQALPGDNFLLPDSYKESITVEALGEQLYEVLVKGNWEYDISEDALFNHDSLVNSFLYSNTTGVGKYITCDVAGMGNDKTIICTWMGNQCTNIYEYKKIDTIQIVEKIKQLQTITSTPTANIAIDRVGIGTGVHDNLKGSFGFIANSKPLLQQPFNSLKDQCYFKFAEMIYKGEIGITAPSLNTQDEIIQELEAHKQYRTDFDKKAQVTPKPLVKSSIGRSPDYADALTMISVFKLKPAGRTVFKSF